MSVMQELDLEISKLRVSKPIFNIYRETGGWSGDSLALKVVDKVTYLPNHQDFVVNPIEALVKLHFNERFDPSRKAFFVDVENIKNRVMGEVRNNMLTFIRHNIGASNDVLCRWYDVYAMHSTRFEKQYLEPMLGIYKYIKMNVHTEDDPSKHKTNAAALLELIFQRDYREEHIPQRQRRRRRRRR